MSEKNTELFTLEKTPSTIFEEEEAVFCLHNKQKFSLSLFLGISLETTESKSEILLIENFMVCLEKSKFLFVIYEKCSNF